MATKVLGSAENTVCAPAGDPVMTIFPKALGKL